jgi:hypothetical protein
VRAADVHYFVCKKIFEALEKTDEAKERNLFGQYSAKRLKDWQDIVKSYEHNNVYLGEAAETLISSVKYEMYATPRRRSITQHPPRMKGSLTVLMWMWRVRIARARVW